MGRLMAILLILLSASCSSLQPQEGISGQVFWVAGNQMPGPGVTRSAQAGIQRELYVYELTTIRQATLKENGFFTNIQTNLILKIATRQDGSFKVKLPPGQYSIFVMEEQGLYANLFDRNNAINPVVVKEKQYSWVPITVDYQAAY